MSVGWLREEWDANTGRLILAACANIEQHKANGRCIYDLGARDFGLREIPVLDPDTRRPMLDDQGREFVPGTRDQGMRPAVTVPDTRPNMVRYAKARLERECAILLQQLVDQKGEVTGR